MNRLFFSPLVSHGWRLCITVNSKLMLRKHYNFKVSFAILIVLFFLSALSVKSSPIIINGYTIPSNQDRVVTGAVVNDDGTPLAGVTVQVKGAGTIVTTVQDGTFSINVANGPATLVFTYVGMQTSEVRITNETTVRINMKSEETTLSDIVVVGYSTQKKVNLTGAVSTVSSKTLLERPAPSVANLLQGRVAGLRVTQPSGQPGRDNGALQIRGLGSFGASSSPLVIIDGIIGSINDLSPNDIENVTVLKDAASASIYGARAANGVILVTTKQGRKGSSIEYQVDLGTQSATRLPKLVTNSAEYMEMYNAARQRGAMADLYTQDEINAYRNATDREQYPNFDWLDYYFNPGKVVNHQLAVSTVTDKTSVRLSLNYLDQDGIVPNINYKRYNAQLNLTNQVTKWIKVGANIRGVFKNNQEPPGWSETSLLAVYQHGPLYKPFLPDGSGRKTAWAYSKEGHNATAPVAFTNGSRATRDYSLNAQAFADVNLYKGLTWTIKAGVNYADNTVKDHIYATQEHYLYHKLPGEADYSLYAPVSAPVGAGLTDVSSKSILPVLYSVLNYETKVGDKHNLNAMVGYEQQSFKYQTLSGSRRIFPTNALTELNAGSTTGQSLSGTAYEWALRSYFGRVAYDYAGKYLVEVNARYDGTSRVAMDNRWGFFPSVSAGWRISEEAFLRDNVSWLSNLKIRGSYGVLGNQEIGNYPYQDILNITAYPFGGAMEQGVILSRLTDKKLRWESTRALDIGVDLDIQKGLFGLTFDWFKKNTFDILAGLPVPASLGLSGPTTNDGELQNTGFEFELRHNNTIGEVRYGVNFIGATFRNKLLSIVTPTKGVNEIGLPYSSFYLYEMNGIFQSQDDIDRSPAHGFYTPKPGDIKIKDQNGDDKIDAEDRVSISPYPDFSYSFGLNVEWKRFSLSTFFQGVKGLRTRIYGWGYDPFVQGDAPSARFRDAWSPTNPSNTEPGVYLGSGWYEGGYPGVYAYPSTYHLPDASYLRLKNVNLSYNFSPQLINKLRLQNLVVYVSADNLLTFTKFPGFDPEFGSSTTRGSVYPQVRILNAGLKIKF